MYVKQINKNTETQSRCVLHQEKKNCNKAYRLHLGGLNKTIFFFCNKLNFRPREYIAAHDLKGQNLGSLVKNSGNFYIKTRVRDRKGRRLYFCLQLHHHVILNS